MSSRLVGVVLISVLWLGCGGHGELADSVPSHWQGTYEQVGWWEQGYEVQWVITLTANEMIETPTGEMADQYDSRRTHIDHVRVSDRKLEINPDSGENWKVIYESKKTPGLYPVYDYVYTGVNNDYSFFEAGDFAKRR